MNIEQANAFIEAIPSIIIYVVPGYIFMWVYAFMFSQKIENDKHAIVKSIVLSFSFVVLFGLLGIEIVFSPYIIFALVAVSALCGLLFSKILASEKAYQLFKKANINKSFYNSIWNDIADFEHGVWIRAYLPNERLIYSGYLKRYEESETEKTLFVLSKYTTYDYTGEVVDNFSGNPENMVALNTKDISRIELFYNPNSKRFKK